MRYIITTIVAALTVALAPASASAKTWECLGPVASCLKAEATQTYTKSYKKQGKVASKKSKKSTSYSSYTGGGPLSGKASFYWQPQALASGGRFNPNALTAAHKTLPFGTRVRVTNRNNGKSVVVVINDRGPYIAGRIIDLSKRAAYVVGMQDSGVVPVSVEILGRGKV
jgi:rare lipoprotein A